jgi:mono/diheme cytochrome c family protein
MNTKAPIAATKMNAATWLFSFIVLSLSIWSCSKGEPAPNDPCAGVTISVTGTTTNPTAGASNGNIIATASGGSGFTYSLNGGAFQSTGQFANLAPGSYTVTAKSSAGCTGSASFTLTATGGCTGVTINITATPTGTTPCVSGSGSISVAATGGTAPYTYSLNNSSQFQSSNTFSNLNQGTYSISVRDANGCSATQSSIAITDRAAGPLFTAVKALIQANCTSCHNANVANGGVNLNADCNIVSARERIRVRAVDGTGGPMPQSGLLPLTERQKITAWINAGGRVTD